MARFHLPSENWHAAALTGDEARHLSQVLRGKAGDSITVFDGHGRRASAKVLQVSRDRVSLEISEVISPAPPQPRITLAQAIPKGKTMDLIVQKAVELGVALLGGLSAPILLFAFARLSWFPVVLYGLVFLIGALVGLEIPLLIRILRHRFAFRELVSNVLTFDYVGALVASLLFPLVLVPWLGMIRTGFVFGLALGVKLHHLGFGGLVYGGRFQRIVNLNR